MELQGHTLSDAEERILAACAGSAFRQIVWDINALYLVVGDACIKVEVVADAPPRAVRNDEYDEIVFVRVHVMPQCHHFETAGENGFWYRVLATDARIQVVEVARTAIRFPSGLVASPESINCDEAYVVADAGVVLTLDDGRVLPAVSLFNSFGFATWPETRLYQRAEVEAHMRGKYVLRAARPN